METEEKKNLLLKDLGARLSYGVKIRLDSPKYGELIGILYAVYPTEERVIVDELDKAIAPINVRCGGFKIEENKVKPYLRPMSSMTEEEKKEFNSLINKVEERCINAYGKGGYTFAFIEVNDWLNAHHFDYRGLIPMGLALEAQEGIYK